MRTHPDFRVFDLAGRRDAPDAAAAVVGHEESAVTGDRDAHLEQPDRITKPAWAHPVIANGKLYIRDHDLLLCYTVKSASGS